MIELCSGFAASSVVEHTVECILYESKHAMLSQNKPVIIYTPVHVHLSNGTAGILKFLY